MQWHDVDVSQMAKGPRVCEAMISYSAYHIGGARLALMPQFVVNVLYANKHLMRQTSELGVSESRTSISHRQAHQLCSALYLCENDLCKIRPSRAVSAASARP